MDKISAITQQQELLLKKKQEIEERRKADLLRNKPQMESKIKTENYTTNTAKSKMFSRHKAILRSGLINKNKVYGSNSSKAHSSNSVADCFESSSTGKDKFSNSKDFKQNNADGENASDSKSSTENTSSDGATSAAWFQEALQRARLKAQEANTSLSVSSAASTVASSPHISSSSGGSSSKRSRWESKDTSSTSVPVSHRPSTTSSNSSSGGNSLIALSVPSTVMNMVADGQHYDAIKGVMLTRLTRESPAIVAYAKQVFGNTEYLSESQWKQCEDQIKMNVVFQLLQAKQHAAERLAQQGKVQYDYDSDEDIDGGTWEHKRRKMEMEKTAMKAQELTDRGAGKHHIGDFLPPEELQKFMEKFCAIREGRDPDFSDYRENKLTEDNIGYKMLKSMGWTEGMGLGPAGKGITQPVNQSGRSGEKHGLGTVMPDNLTAEDSEYDAYRKRMMLSYRFRPNPLNNPRRPYY